MVIYPHHNSSNVVYQSPSPDSSDKAELIIFFVVIVLLSCAVYFRCSYSERNDAEPTLPVHTRSYEMRQRYEMNSPPNSPVVQTSRIPVATTIRTNPSIVVANAIPVAYGETVSHQSSVNENLTVDSMKRSVATVLVSATGKTSLSMKGKSDVVQVRCEKDGRHYFVAADLPEKERAANLLAEIARRAQYLLQSIDEQMDNSRRVVALDGTDITDNMKALLRKHYKVETPLAEYHNPSDLTVGSNSDKGVVIETCLRSKFDPTEWSSINTLFRVHTHELAHSADFDYREDGEDGHGPVFKRLHKHLLGVSENLGIYNCAEYTRSGGALCGVKLTESYQCGDKPVK